MTPPARITTSHIHLAVLMRQAALYNYLNCLSISPCRGWMNSNETLRNATTARAVELSAVLQKIASDGGYDMPTFFLVCFVLSVVLTLYDDNSCTCQQPSLYYKPNGRQLWYQTPSTSSLFFFCALASPLHAVIVAHIIYSHADNLTDHDISSVLGRCTVLLYALPSQYQLGFARVFVAYRMYACVRACTRYTNFNTHYIPNAFNDVIAEWSSMGGQEWQLIEPVDGFHPNQIANALTVDAVWKRFDQMGLMPPVNPNNAEIEKLFGDQGGY